MLAGYFRGWTDAIISRGLDVMWAFPVLLLGVALGVSLALGGLKIGPISIQGDSLWIPTLIIGVVNVVYLARPIRGQVLGLREKEFIEAARAQGVGQPPDHVHRAAAEPRVDAARLLPAASSPTRSCSRRRCRSSARACSRPSRRGAR